MGNCQAVDAAALVIQHPSGKIDRMYWPIAASEVMKMNPGHYVSLIIPLPIGGEENSDDKTVRFTRVKLLRPSEKLVLGRAYRLVTSQEVMKVLRAKKYAKMRKNQPPESTERKATDPKESIPCGGESGRTEPEKVSQVPRHERRQQRPGSKNFAAAMSKSWRPSLQSISEAGTQ